MSTPQAIELWFQVANPPPDAPSLRDAIGRLVHVVTTDLWLLEFADGRLDPVRPSMVVAVPRPEPWLRPIPAYAGPGRPPGVALGSRHLKTHCSHGHEFTPENTLVRPHQRVCRACTNLGKAASRARLAGPSMPSKLEASVNDIPL